MTQVQGPPPGTTLVEDAPVAKASGRGKGGGKAPKVKMGANRWFREIGWRHLVGVIAVDLGAVPGVVPRLGLAEPPGQRRHLDADPAAVQPPQLLQAARRAALRHVGPQQPDRLRVRRLRAAALQLARRLRVQPVPVHRTSRRPAGAPAHPDVPAVPRRGGPLPDVHRHRRGDPGDRPRHPPRLHPHDVRRLARPGVADQGVLRLDPDVARRGRDARRRQPRAGVLPDHPARSCARSSRCAGCWSSSA